MPFLSLIIKKGNNKITNKGVIILSQSKWNNLIVLDLGISIIAKIKTIYQIRAWNIWLEFLFRSYSNWIYVNMFKSGSNYISDEGILHLSKRSLPNLRIFLISISKAHIDDNKMTFNCFFYLNKLNSKNLNKLMLCN